MKNFLKIALISFPILTTFTAQANVFAPLVENFKGSYLFCVNEKNTYKWKWAAKNENFNNKYKGIKKITTHSEEWTWLKGSPSLNKHFNIVLDIKHEFQSMNEAKEFCEELKNICTSQYGDDYSLVGVSSYAVPGWGLVSVRYPTPVVETESTAQNDYASETEPLLGYEVENIKSKTSSCPNWNYKEFPNAGGAKYDVERMITDRLFSQKK
ncbi:hypothetical protein QEJ31_10430 [Pigmentibacter sp. JX0631]|uniref:hypothetical protein n=1 Tax=Pigmentibacter sp. JX0631 TaxID=2976982 RepID=UPI002469B7D5|nr:hypothetical protein [Pigmentibacter sp. JX0631]WGL58937.1 hypothetical protein QEJ31_10430 [Pigmentibacter sp. JX0631]